MLYYWQQIISTHMAELTTEYLDKKLEGLATKDDLKGFATKQDLTDAITAAVKPLATKQDVTDAVEELARIIATTIAEPMQQKFEHLEETLELRLKVKSLEQVLEHNLTKLEGKLNIELEHAS